MSQPASLIQQVLARTGLQNAAPKVSGSSSGFPTISKDTDAMDTTTVYGLQFDTVGSLPFTAALHAYYINGKYATRPVAYRRGAVWIDVLGNAARSARWFDVESEDGTPAMVAAWLDEREAAVGPNDRGIYCSRSNLAAVVDNAAGRNFDLWLATLDGTMFPSEFIGLPSNVNPVLVQSFPASYLGINADVSVVINQTYWKGYALAS